VRSSVFQAISKIANLIRFRIPILLLKQTPFADNASYADRYEGKKIQVLVRKRGSNLLFNIYCGLSTGVKNNGK
jgi:hypothetical protein